MISIMVPATSANVGVGFDSLGLAVDWTAQFDFEKSSELIVEGCPEEYCGEDNLVVSSFKTTCEILQKEFPAFKLRIHSDIPFARGLGSSSTCVVAGVAGCNAWFNAGLSKEEILDICTRIEGHPDNVAPAIYGQAVCCIEEQGVKMMPVFLSDWNFVTIIPDYEVSTAQARKLLPDSLSFKSAVSQVGHALVFLQALSYGDEKTAYYACKDVLHEPYRKTLIKEYEGFKKICADFEIPGWISGSGSTLMAGVVDNEKAVQVADRARQELTKCKVMILKSNKQGCVIQYEQ